MKHETIHFADALNESLGNPTRIIAEAIPASFANLSKTSFGSGRAGLQQIEKKEFEVSMVESQEHDELPIFKFDTSDVRKVIDNCNSPTREAYTGAMEALGRLEDQSIVSNALAIKIQKQMKHKANPNHYGTKSTKRAKLSKPAKFFGNSKDIVFVKVKGEVKPMSMKNAKKFGHI